MPSKASHAILGKQGDSMTFEHHFDIKIINSKVGAVDNKTERYPRTYVDVACDGMTQRTAVTGGEERPLRPKTTWNEKFHFCCRGGRKRNDIEFSITLYKKGASGSKKDIILGEVKENLAQFQRNKDFNRKFKNSSIAFRVGKTNIRNVGMFALTIGIDEYRSDDIPNLAGCVHDAKDMETFLKTELHVPDSNICVLHNKAATRTNILNKFNKHLIQNPNIKDGRKDSLVIFFAGHGNRVRAPNGWIAPDGMIEVLCPYDEWSKDRNGKRIPGIPDRTVNSLVRKLATAKGNNITLILDSCHSGGSSRDREYTARSFPKPCPITSSTDKNIWTPAVIGRSASFALLNGFKHKDMASHVLLAACKFDEQAHETEVENKKRGLFTSALIHKLRESIGGDSSDTTSYANLIDSLPSLGRKPNQHQTPQCEGENKTCPIFTLDVPTSSNARFFKLQHTENGYEVNIGAMHGVIAGTAFHVQRSQAEHDRLPKDTTTGILVATTVFLSKSFLSRHQDNPRLHIPDNAEVSVSNSHNQPFCLNIFADFKGASKHIKDASSAYPTSIFSLVKARSKAHISISVDNEGKAFIVTRLRGFLSSYPDIRSISEQQYPQKDDSNRPTFSRILHCISQFRCQLQHCAVSHENIKVTYTSESSGTSGVHMHLFQLSKDKYGFPVPKTSENIFNDKGVATLSPIDLLFAYGIAITNASDRDLFAYLFYFDPGDYSIQEWYLPNNASRAIKKSQTLTIGYGAGGGDPVQFSLEEGEKGSTGFLKLIMSTQYADMSHLIQSSPLFAQVGAERMKIVKKEPMNVDAYVSMVAEIRVVQ